MKVSIITVAFNAAATIEDTIRSVLEQNYGNIEYIVVDGASQDGTQDIIRKWEPKGISKWISEPDKGIYDGMNKGLELATGDIVGILNSDDFYTHPEVISRVVACMQTHGADALYSDLDYVDGENKNKVVRKWISGSYQPADFLNGWMPPHPTFFVKRGLYKQFGKFRSDLKSAADYELMLRFLYKNKVVAAYLPETTIHMRTGGMSNQSFSNRLRANKEDRKAWELNGLQPKWYTLYLKPLRKVGQFLKK